MRLLRDKVFLLQENMTRAEEVMVRLPCGTVLIKLDIIRLNKGGARPATDKARGYILASYGLYHQKRRTI